MTSDLHYFVWKEALDDWLLYDATFYISKSPDAPGRINYANFVFYKRQKDEYFVHELTIMPLYNEVMTGEAIFHDTSSWRGFDLKELKVQSADQALLIAEENGGNKACLLLNKQCEIGVWLTPSLHEYGDFLSIPLFRYEWKWNVAYYDEGVNQAFYIDIDPYTGKYRIPDINK